MAMAILAEPIVMIIFGEKWRTGIPILQILLIYAMIRSTANPIGSLFLATGRVDLGLWWNASIFVLIPIMIYIGSTFGLNGIAWSQLMLQFSLTVPVWFFLVNKMCGAGFVEYMKQIVIPLTLAVASAAIASIGMLIVESYFLQVLLVGSIGFVVYLLLNVYLNKSFITMLKAFK